MRCMRRTLNAIAKCISTFFYVGLLSKMPGTWGSLTALPFAWFLWQLSSAWIIFFLSFLLAVWSAGRYCGQTKKHDNQQIVIDEVLGIFLTTAIVPHTYLFYFLAFVLFRFFDIVKPPPVRWVDRNVQGGFGVVADDLVAAFWAMLILKIILWV